MNNLAGHISSLPRLQDAVPYNLFIVDEDIDISQQVARQGERLGWSCVICNKPAHLAKEMTLRPGPALVLIDVDLREDREGEILECLGQVEQPLRLRFVTGINGAHVVAASLMARARDFSVGTSLLKPFNPESLQRMLMRERLELENR